MTFEEFKKRLEDHKGRICIYGRNTYARVQASEALSAVKFGVETADAMGVPFKVIFPAAGTDHALWLDAVDQGEPVTP